MLTSHLRRLAGVGLGAMMMLDCIAPGSAMPMPPAGAGLSVPSDIVDVATACGPRGCVHGHGGYRPGYPGGVYRPGYHGGVYRPGYPGAVARPGYVYRGGIYRGGVYGGVWHGGPWVRGYGWPVGGAIAAGAAIGFIAAASAPWAPPPPQPGLCWYYTDSTQRQGFWDVCP